MTIQDLNQYKSIKREIVDLQQRINQKTNVTDVVVGSSSEPPYVKHPISITGCEYCTDRQEKRYKNRIIALRQKAEEIEEYIEAIDDSLVRQSIRLHYIDELPWLEAARRIGGGNTADSIRMAVKRYLLSQ